jgi:hypothetical protein
MERSRRSVDVSCIRRPRHSRPRWGGKTTTCAGRYWPEAVARMLPTASKRKLGAFKMPWAACQRRTSGAAFTLELTWLGQATRSRARTLGHRRVTSYEATMGGIAYGGHRKAAVGWTEGPTSAASAKGTRVPTGPERVKPSCIAFSSIV